MAKKFYGLSVVSKAALKRREKKDIKPMKVTLPFPLDGFCCQGDIDKCQVHCGACIEAGGFENLPKLATYTV